MDIVPRRVADEVIAAFERARRSIGADGTVSIADGAYVFRALVTRDSPDTCTALPIGPIQTKLRNYLKELEGAEGFHGVVNEAGSAFNFVVFLRS